MASEEVIRIYTVFHSVCACIWTNNIELSDWLSVRNGCWKLNLFSRIKVNHSEKFPPMILKAHVENDAPSKTGLRSSLNVQLTWVLNGKQCRSWSEAIWPESTPFTRLDKAWLSKTRAYMPNFTLSDKISRNVWFSESHFLIRPSNLTEFLDHLNMFYEEIHKNSTVCADYMTREKGVNCHHMEEKRPSAKIQPQLLLCQPGIFVSCLSQTWLINTF